MHNLRLTLLFSVLAGLLQAQPGALESARATVKEWAATEKAVSREAAEWAGRETLLKDLIAVEAERIERLEKELAKSQTGLSQADEERSELLDRQDALVARAGAIGDFLAKVEAELQTLRDRLPEPLAEDLATMYRRLPKNPENTTLSLGERMRTVITLLGRVRQFDGKLTVTESIRALPSGNGEASVRTLYLGLAQAYYLAPDDAGIGRPGPEGWMWESRPEFEEAIRDAIRLAEGGAREPKFIGLPVRIENGEEVER